MINEKIYIFLWFWFLILSGWTVIHFCCYRLVTIVARYDVHGTKKNIINFYYSDPRVFLSFELVPSPATYKTFK